MTEFVYFRIGREFGYKKKPSWDYIFAEAVINAAVPDEAFRHVDKKWSKQKLSEIVYFEKIYPLQMI